MQNKCALRAKSPEQTALTLGGAWDNTGDGVHTYALCVDCFCRQSIQQTVVRLSLRSTGLYNFMPDGTRKCDLYPSRTHARQAEALYWRHQDRRESVRVQCMQPGCEVIAQRHAQLMHPAGPQRADA